MGELLVVMFAVPLVGAALALLVGERTAVNRWITLTCSLAMLGMAVALVWLTRDGTVLATGIGGWPARFRITFVADGFAALMLTVSALMITVCVLFAAASGDDERRFFHPLVLVLAAGVAGGYLTADIFDLFVFVEVTLIASYVLLTLPGSRRQIRAAGVYVTTSLLASTTFVAGIALLYASAGTVNFAELVGRAAASDRVAVAGVVILVALGVKAAFVPVHGWLPRSYSAASPAVTALFSGLLTKIGLYAIFRLYSTLFAGDATLRVPLLVIASLTMVLGVLGAVGRDRMRDVLLFHMVSQIGYMVLGLALFGIAGLSAGIFYIFHHIVVKASLLLCAGAVETFEGTGALGRLGALARERPVLAAAFGISALSLAGVPPLSGFVAKLALLRAAFDLDQYAAGGVAVAVSFVTLFSMVKIWNGVFWGERQREPQPAVVVTRPRAAALVAPAAALAVLTVVIGLGAQGLWMLAESAASVLVDPTPYVRAVLR
jgi:multicomponent Na+:H+ antiporter subunit D